MDTLDEIRRKGLEALRKALGPVNMVRFLQQFELGKGDYAKQRAKWVNKTSLKEIAERAKELPVRKKRRKT